MSNFMKDCPGGTREKTERKGVWDIPADPLDKKEL